jgi:hypothetical protein
VDDDLLALAVEQLRLLERFVDRLDVALGGRVPVGTAVPVGAVVKRATELGARAVGGILISYAVTFAGCVLSNWIRASPLP